MMMNMCIILFIMLGIYNWLYQTLCDEMIMIIIVVLAWIQVFIIFKTERDHLHQTEQNKKQKKKKWINHRWCLLLGGKSIDFDTTTTTIRLEKMVNGKKSYIIFYYIENTFDGRGIKNSFHPPHSNILKDF